MYISYIVASILYLYIYIFTIPKLFAYIIFVHVHRICIAATLCTHIIFVVYLLYTFYSFRALIYSYIILYHFFSPSPLPIFRRWYQLGVKKPKAAAGLRVKKTKKLLTGKSSTLKVRDYSYAYRVLCVYV